MFAADAERRLQGRSLVAKNRKQTLQSFSSLVLAVLTGEQGFQASALVNNGGNEMNFLVFLFFLTCIGIAAHAEERRIAEEGGILLLLLLLLNPVHHHLHGRQLIHSLQRELEGLGLLGVGTNEEIVGIIDG